MIMGGLSRSEWVDMLRFRHIEKYETYVREYSRYPVKCLFYVFGFGWSDNDPETVYVIPSYKIYDYDKTDDEAPTITFLQKGSREEKAKLFEKYKCAGPCVMYRI